MVYTVRVCVCVLCCVACRHRESLVRLFLVDSVAHARASMIFYTICVCVLFEMCVGLVKTFASTSVINCTLGNQWACVCVLCRCLGGVNADSYYRPCFAPCAAPLHSFPRAACIICEPALCVACDSQVACVLWFSVQFQFSNTANLIELRSYEFHLHCRTLIASTNHARLVSKQATRKRAHERRHTSTREKRVLFLEFATRFGGALPRFAHSHEITQCVFGKRLQGVCPYSSYAA